MGAAKDALTDGRLETKDIDPTRFGVLIGSGVGGLEAVESSCRILFEKGPKRITPFLLPSIIGNTAGSMVAIELGAKGPNYGVVRIAAGFIIHTASAPCLTWRFLNCGMFCSGERVRHWNSCAWRGVEVPSAGRRGCDAGGRHRGGNHAAWLRGFCLCVRHVHHG